MESTGTEKTTQDYGQSKNMIAGNSTNRSDLYYHNINNNLDNILPLYAVILLASLFGNAVVCITILRDVELRRRRWYFLLINLSVADAAFALTTMSYVMQLKGIDTGKQ